MKRTPDSAKRRASRHCRPKSSVSGVPMPYRRSVASDSPVQLEHRRRRRLHAEAELVRLHHPFDLRVVLGPSEVRVVQLLDQVELPSLHRAGKFVVGEKGDRGTLHRDVGRADRRSLIDGRQKRAGIVLHAAMSTRRGDRDEAGQVAVFGPQSVRDPRPQRRSHEIGRAGVQPQSGLAVGAAFGVHAVDHAQVVHMPGDVRKQFGDPATALAVLGEFPGSLAQQREAFSRA